MRAVFVPGALSLVSSSPGRILLPERLNYLCVRVTVKGTEEPPKKTQFSLTEEEKEEI